MTNAFLPTDQKSGVPFQVHYLANALVERGHSVTVFTFSPRPADASYEVVSFPRPRTPLRFWPFYMAFRLARTDFSQFDVLHVHGDNYLLGSDRKHLRTFHGAAKDEMRTATRWRRRAYFFLTNILEQIGSRVSTINVGVSETTRAAFSNIHAIVPCGVDLDAFKAAPKNGEPTVLFVGSERGRKRGAWFAEVFKRDVRPRIPSAKLLMVTDVVASEPGVIRLGRVSKEELLSLYGSAWVFCLPSTYEGFGVPYIEAMASGTAVVATEKNPGATEVLCHGKFGALVPDDVLGDKLYELLSDAACRETLEHAGLVRSRDFGWDKITSAYEELYRSLV